MLFALSQYAGMKLSWDRSILKYTCKCINSVIYRHTRYLYVKRDGVPEVGAISRAERRALDYLAPAEILFTHQKMT